ncbi:L,D-transpeptidase catalytic domain [Syntrophomonas zehnderi OL-4]|uniref:L,D-transpeptidase catalytic domain n=1 Tax=Syntrophomonas zehnderi OL-4 TaxID=690567 RepID=A0A0E4GAA4_9FIRM|nr:peptidoglycan-binding protein [Syntrophomonas zehnderi]CFX27077.1 L,D-transpeptidase catalytic domain [Syntrophomonas zehnderi OL-4]
MVRKPLIIIIVSICFFLLVSNQIEARSESNQPSTPPIRVDNTDYPVLYVGEPCLEGEAVWMVQARLRDLGYEIVPNGRYDLKTSEVVRLFQLAHHLKTNGVVSKSEWECLMYDEPDTSCLTEATKNQPKVMIEIDIGKHNLKVFHDRELIKEYPVGVGKWKTPSPLGEWKVVNKGMGWGNGFGTRWMGLNVPWGIYGIHGTDKPYSIGASMSHGCIRMRNRDVEDLYPRIPVGTTVKIVENGQIFPKNFNGRPLKKKQSGQNVVYLQSRLKEVGIIFDRADGRFGSMTELAVKYYQIWHGLEPTGIADEATYRSLGMIK